MGTEIADALPRSDHFGSPSVVAKTGVDGFASRELNSPPPNATEAVSFLAPSSVGSAPTDGQITAERRPDAKLSVWLAPPRVPPPRPVQTFLPLQEWEGCVTKIDDKRFWAELKNLTAGERFPTEEAEIPLEELSAFDAARLEIGVLFRWVIGYWTSPQGEKRNISQIVLRDLPRITKADIERGRAWADEMLRWLGANDSAPVASCRRGRDHAVRPGLWREHRHAHRVRHLGRGGLLLGCQGPATGTELS